MHAFQRFGMFFWLLKQKLHMLAIGFMGKTDKHKSFYWNKIIFLYKWKNTSLIRNKVIYIYIINHKKKYKKFKKFNSIDRAYKLINRWVGRFSL